MQGVPGNRLQGMVCRFGNAVGRGSAVDLVVGAAGLVRGSRRRGDGRSAAAWRSLRATRAAKMGTGAVLRANVETGEPLGTRVLLHL